MERPGGIEKVKLRTEAPRNPASGSRAVLAPQCGLAPGFIGIVGADLAQKFSRLRDIELRVGALPAYPNGQLGYSFTWSPAGVINEYLNDEYPHPPELLPEDSGDRARIRLLVDFADRAFTLPVMALERETKAAEKDDARIQAAREAVAKALQMLERELAGREYLGEDFSLADVAFAPALLMLPQVGITIDGGLTNVAAWKARLLSRPSIGKAAKAA